MLLFEEEEGGGIIGSGTWEELLHKIEDFVLDGRGSLLVQQTAFSEALPVGEGDVGFYSMGLGRREVEGIQLWFQEFTCFAQPSTMRESHLVRRPEDKERDDQLLER